MITPTPSPNKTTPTKRREPLRWLIPAALLLLFLSICCIGQVVIMILSPRNQASNLNLLSKDLADYNPWKIQLKLPPIAPGAAAAQAADRATETAQATLSPTPLIIANVPTSEVIVIAAPQNAPTNTPGSALITPQPTVTPRPLALGPTDTPVISTAAPGATTVAILPTPTDTPRPATPTDTASAGSQPTRTSTLAPATATNTPRPADTTTPTRIPPTKVAPPPATDTAVPPPPATDTAVPPPPATDTAVPQPTASNTAVPPPPPPRDTNTPLQPTNTRTPTPVTPTATRTPTPSVTNTPVAPSATNTATATPVTPTATNTATATPVTPTNTPTSTPTPICGTGSGALTIVKFEANNNYTQAAGQPIDFTICIINDSTAPVAIQGVSDTMPTTWQWGNLSCDVSGTNATTVANIACSSPGGPFGGVYAWGHQDGVSPLIMNPGDRIDLRIHGSYLAAGTRCNGPESAGIGYKVTLADTTVLAGNSACITVQ